MKRSVQAGVLCLMALTGQALASRTAQAQSIFTDLNAPDRSGLYVVPVTTGETASKHLYVAGDEPSMPSGSDRVAVG